MTITLVAEPELLEPEDRLLDMLPFELQHTSDGRLFAILGGERVAVLLRQCFPWSEPSRFLSLWIGEEREVAFIDDPTRLAPQSRQSLEAALAAAGFVLQVTHVKSIKEEVEIRQWNVMTPHGPRSFQTHLDDWPRPLPGGALLIRDVAGDLYRIPAAANLDKHSRQTMWAFID